MLSRVFPFYSKGDSQFSTILILSNFTLVMIAIRLKLIKHIYFTACCVEISFFVIKMNPIATFTRGKIRYRIVVIIIADSV